jgi:hypothetical protein
MKAKNLSDLLGASSEDLHYSEYVRKEARFRLDQLERLTALQRQLNRSRKGGRRITENTLIRVAVDYLLLLENDLSGASEEDLMASLKRASAKVRE